MLRVIILVELEVMRNPRLVPYLPFLIFQDTNPNKVDLKNVLVNFFLWWVWSEICYFYLILNEIRFHYYFIDCSLIWNEPAKQTWHETLLLNYGTISSLKVCGSMLAKKRPKKTEWRMTAATGIKTSVSCQCNGAKRYHLQFEK